MATAEGEAGAARVTGRGWDCAWKRCRPHLVVGSLLGVLVLSGLHVRFRDALLDARFSLLQRPATGTVALVEIDSRSIEGFGVWPWPRTLHAQLIERLEEAGATDVVFDVDFSSPSSPMADEALAAALRSSGGSTVLAAFKQRVADRGDGKTIDVNRPIPLFAGSAWLALVNVLPDRDGVIRSYGYGEVLENEFYPSVGALLAGKQQTGAAPFRIDYGIQAETLPSFSYVDVVRRVPAVMAALKGKKVVVSGTAAELGDRFVVPNGRIIPGSMVQALAAESILQGRALVVPSHPIALASAALIVLLMLLAWTRTKPRDRVIGVLVAAVLAEGAAYAVQAFAPIAPDTSLVWAAAGAYALAIGFEELDLRNVLKGIAERRFQRIAMSLGDGLVCTDKNGSINLWNPGASAIFGYEESEVRGRPFDILLSGAGGENNCFDLTSLPLDRLHQAGGIVSELTGRRKSGEQFDLECSLSAWDAADGAQYGAVLRDISQRKRQQERITYLAEYDTLTGLLNGNSLLTRLEQAMQGADTPNGGCILVLVGVNRLQQISDLHGYSFGNRLLTAISDQLRAAVARDEVLARLGGDEFAILCFSGEAAARQLADRIATRFEHEPVMLDGQQHRVAVSLGLAAMTAASSAEELLGNAHFALAEAKLSSKAAPVGFEPRMRDSLKKRHSLEAELRRALAHEEFELFYQPQVELGTSRLLGAEALIRWRHPERGYVSPGEFLPLVNTTSLSEPIGKWVVETACRRAADWQRAGTPIRIGINLAQSQFAAGDFAMNLEHLLRETGLSATLLEFEVTEDIILDNIERTQRMLAAIRELGATIAFDDFGTGYGSLSYLRTFPLDKIKIDRSFVTGIVSGTEDAAIVSSTLALSKALGLSVIAEGIETAEIADALLRMGCTEGQGYLFGKPVPAAEFEAAWFRDNVVTAEAA